MILVYDVNDELRGVVVFLLWDNATACQAETYLLLHSTVAVCLHEKYTTACYR